MRVLIVDDNALIWELMSRLISKEHQVRKACHGCDALDIIESEANFDLIISDFYLGNGPAGINILQKTKEISPEQKLS